MIGLTRTETTALLALTGQALPDGLGRLVGAHGGHERMSARAALTRCEPATAPRAPRTRA